MNIINGLLSLTFVVVALWCIVSVYLGSIILQKKIVWLWHEWFIPELRTYYWKSRRKYKRFKRKFDRRVRKIKYLFKFI